MKKTVIVQAPAKINLSLDITGKRPDGYHLLHSVMQSIDLCDMVALSQITGTGIYISCNRSRIPCDENNLAYVAAIRFFEAFGVGQDMALAIDLDKRIPLQAGLGGGSADAAAVLMGLNAMCEVHAGLGRLCQVGALVGADVPFCIMGGTMCVTGIGEELTPLPPMPECQIVVAQPGRGINTADAYRRYDLLSVPPRADSAKLLKSLDFGDLAGVAETVANVLEAACSVPEVRLIKEHMMKFGALGAAMTGSGSAVFGIFDNRPLAKRCMRRLYDFSESVFLVRPISRGVMVTRTSDT